MTLNLRLLLMQDEKNLMSDEDAERDALYERAEQVSNDLSHMALELRDCIDNVNARSVANQADASNPLSKIVRILNNQLQALTHVDESTEQVAQKLQEVTGLSTASLAMHLGFLQVQWHIALEVHLACTSFLLDSILETPFGITTCLPACNL